jgi:hypothetical protein
MVHKKKHIAKSTSPLSLSKKSKSSRMYTNPFLPHQYHIIYWANSVIQSSLQTLLNELCNHTRLCLIIFLPMRKLIKMMITCLQICKTILKPVHIFSCPSLLLLLILQESWMSRILYLDHSKPQFLKYKMVVSHPPYLPYLRLFWEIDNSYKTALTDTLKQLRPIGKGEQVLEKRLDQKELT